MIIEYLRKVTQNPYEASQQRIRDTINHIIEKRQPNHYYYKTAVDKEANIWGRQSVRPFIRDCEINPQLKTALEKKPDQGMRIPILFGEKKAGNPTYIDILGRHILISGKTQNGKTNWLNSLILSLIYLSHPSYLRVCIADAKKFSFKQAEKIITISRNVIQHTQLINYIYQEMCSRQKTMQKSQFSSVKDHNEWCKQERKEEQTIPYIIFIFDEFEIFTQQYESYQEEKKAKEAQQPSKQKKAQDRKQGIYKDPIKQMHELSGQALACGIQLIVTTQAAYTKYIEGATKNNMEIRISFKVGDIQHDTMILGQAREGEQLTTSLKVGEFLTHGEEGQREKYKSILVKDHTLATACKRIGEKRSFKIT